MILEQGHLQTATLSMAIRVTSGCSSKAFTLSSYSTSMFFSSSIMACRDSASIIFLSAGKGCCAIMINTNTMLYFFNNSTYKNIWYVLMHADKLIQMQKDERSGIRQKQLRYRLLPFFYTHAEKALVPLGVIEVTCEGICYLQLLKYPIDYFSHRWLGSTTALFLWLDPSYYAQFVSSLTFDIILIFTLLAMLLYIAIPITFALLWPKRTHLQANIVRVAYLVVKNALLVPIISMLFSILNCDGQTELHSCIQPYNIGIKMGILFFLLVWLIFVMGQAYSSYDFLLYPTYFVHVKKSALTSVGVVIFVLLNEGATFFSESINLALLHLSAFTMLFLTVLLQQHHSQFFQLLQISVYAVICFILIYLDAVILFGPMLPVALMPLLSILLILAIMQLRTYSIDFELKNVNKWPTSAIMMRYAYTLRWFLSQRQEPLYATYLYGYMEIHRQKCDNYTCPSRRPLNSKEEALFNSGKWPRTHEQFLRVDNIIKKLWGDGYRLSPISAELQLQNATFLYERGEKQQALRTLLKIDQDALPLNRIYWHTRLRNKIQDEFKDIKNQEFLDLLTDLQVKECEGQLFRLFQKAALLNLQFWSHLNEDYPDFGKFSEAALSKVQMRQQIRKSYAEISQMVFSQRATAYYASYLQMIENDQSGIEDITAGLRENYNLNECIQLRDWNNASECVMMISTDDATYGEIVELNTSCASMLGYKRHQLLHQNLTSMFIEEYKKTEEMKELLGVKSNGQCYHLTHRNGYQIAVRKQSQIYNSMGTGITSILVLSYDPLPNQCHLLIDRESKIVGATASIFPILGLELKEIDSQPKFDEVFTFQIAHPPEGGDTFRIEEIIRKQFYRLTRVSKYKVRVIIEKNRHHWRVTVENMAFSSTNSSKTVCRFPFGQFKFGVEANLDSFCFLATPSLVPIMRIDGFVEGVKQSSRMKSSQRPNYAEGISLLRLRDNVIVMSQDEQAIEQEQFGGSLDHEESSQAAILSQAASSQIFTSHEQFEKFIEEHRVGQSILWALLLTVGLMFSLNIVFYALNFSANQSIWEQLKLTAYQNLIIGATMKEKWLMTDLHLIISNMSDRDPPDFLHSYNDNRQYLQSILLKGESSATLHLTHNNITQSPASSIFLQTLINYANSFATPIPVQNTTLTDLTTALNSLNDYQRNYLGNMSYQAATQLFKEALQQEVTTAEHIATARMVDAIMLVCGIVGTLGMIATLLFMVHLINLEKKQLLSTFLQLSEQATQVLGEKCQKFLISLHNEEGLEGGEQQDLKRGGSSTMGKRKRFKEVRFEKSIYIKLVLLPLIYCGYTIHGHIISNFNLRIQDDANKYVRLTASGDYQLNSVMSRHGEWMLRGSGSSPIGANILLDYYREYIHFHYASYGRNTEFNRAFMRMFIGDICSGMDSSYGNISIPLSCILGELSQKGIYQIMSQVISFLQSREQTLNTSQPLPQSLSVELEVLSSAHRVLTDMLLETVEASLSNERDSMLEALMIWIVVGLLVGLLVAVPVVVSFLDEVNEVKSVVSCLPISIARSLTNLRNYVAKIIAEQR